MTYGLCCCIQLGCVFRRVSYAAGTPAGRLLHAPYDGATRRRIDTIALQHRADGVQPRGAARTLIMCFRTDFTPKVRAVRLPHPVPPDVRHNRAALQRRTDGLQPRGAPCASIVCLPADGT